MFPKWTNHLRVVVLIVALVVPLYAGAIVYFGFSPETTDVGYAPRQPIAYSHALHVGQLGIDCRYCHNTVDHAAHAAIPPSRTCINCHDQQYGVRRDSEKLQLLMAAYYGSERVEAGRPIPWVRIHDLPDYAYFSHSAHVTRGVACVRCHGRIDQMEVVYQAEPLSMGWCLECHRDPGPNLLPASDRATRITDMTWAPPTADEREAYAQQRIEEYNIRGVEYLQSCSVCHR